MGGHAGNGRPSVRTIVTVMQETELYGKVVTFCVAIQERD